MLVLNLENCFTLTINVPSVNCCLKRMMMEPSELCEKCGKRPATASMGRYNPTYRVCFSCYSKALTSGKTSEAFMGWKKVVERVEV